MTEKSETVVASEIAKLLKKYNRWASQLQFLTVLFTLVSIFTSVAIGFFVDDISTYWIKILAGVSALSTALLTGLRLSKKAQDLRDAYRYLQHAMYQYQASPGFVINDLIEAYNAAERIVGHIETGDFTKVINTTNSNKQQ